MFAPTYLTPRSASWQGQQGQQLSSPFLPTVAASNPFTAAQAALYQGNMPGIPATPNFAPSQSNPDLPAVSGAGGTVAGANATPVLTPTHMTGAQVSIPQSQQQNVMTPPGAVSPAATPLPPASLPEKRSFSTRYLLFAVPLILVLLAGGLGSWILFNHSSAQPS